MTPNWTAGRKSSMFCLKVERGAGSGTAEGEELLHAVSRTLMRANSAATKKLLARMKKATMITRKSIHSSIP